jgi:hypothetical protein
LVGEHDALVEVRGAFNCSKKEDLLVRPVDHSQRCFFTVNTLKIPRRQD